MLKICLVKTMFHEHESDDLNQVFTFLLIKLCVSYCEIIISICAILKSYSIV